MNTKMHIQKKWGKNNWKRMNRMKKSNEYKKSIYKKSEDGMIEKNEWNEK